MSATPANGPGIAARLRPALIDAAKATAVAFGLSVIMVGLRTDVSPSGALFLRTRWDDVAILCALAFAGRLAMSLWVRPRFVAAGLARSEGALMRAGALFAPLLLAVALLLGFPVLRLRGDYLAIVTLAFGEIIRIVLLNWVSLTGGPNGITGIPRPTFFGLPFSMEGGPGTFAGFFGLEPSPTHRVVFLYYLILALALLTNWVSIRIRRQPIGRAWEALREDEVACRALGINIVTTKLTAFALGAMFGGFAGAFFATRQAFISPESFTFIESAIILAIVVLGGLGSQIGIAVAAIVMIGGFEVFRDLDEWRMLVFGAAMVLIMVLRPRGLVGSRTPTVTLGASRVIDSKFVGEGRG